MTTTTQAQLFFCNSVPTSFPIFTSTEVRRASSDGPMLKNAAATAAAEASSGWSFSFPPPLCKKLRQVSNEQPQRRTLIPASNSTASDDRQEHRRRQERAPHSSSRTSWTWRITNAMLEPVPSYYPLEPSSIVIRNIPIHIVSARISNYMRINSIACSYQFGTTRVNCTTSKLSRFAINLWKSGENITTKPRSRHASIVGQRIILELRRLQGCAIEMQKIRNGLFHAVVSGDEPSDHCTRVDERLCASRLLQEVYDQRIDSDKTPMSSTDSQMVCLKMLQSKFRDQNRLGMESLKVLSNHENANRDSAHSVSQNLIYDKGQLGCELRESLLKYFVNVERPSDTVDSEDEFQQCDSDIGDDEIEYSRGSHFGAMHNLALKVLANALEKTFRSNDADHPRSKSSPQLELRCDFWTTVLEALVYDLTVSSYRPNEGALAARCLLWIVELVPHAATSHEIEGRLLPALIEANEYGKSYHVALERETESLMRRLVDT